MTEDQWRNRCIINVFQRHGVLLKEYKRGLLFTRATGDEFEVKGSKDDPLVCTVVRCADRNWFREQTCVSAAHQARHRGFPKRRGDAGGNRRVSFRNELSASD